VSSAPFLMMASSFASCPTFFYPKPLPTCSLAQLPLVV
jgi:hypothetical protein